MEGASSVDGADGVYDFIDPNIDADREPGTMRIGDRVAVVGLKNAQQFNGKEGVVVSVATEESGRIGVRLDTVKKPLAVKLENLVPI